MKNGERIVNNLPVKLTQTELVQTGRKLANAQHNLQRAENEKKEAMSDFKNRIDRHTLEISNLSEVISSGEEYRPVECTRFYDRANKRVIVTRSDTGAVISDCPMDEEMSQLCIDEVSSDTDEDEGEEGSDS